MSLTDIMSNAGLTFYPLVAFALCFAAFIAIVLREIARSRGEVEHASKLPHLTIRRFRKCLGKAIITACDRLPVELSHVPDGQPHLVRRKPLVQHLGLCPPGDRRIEGTSTEVLPVVFVCDDGGERLFESANVRTGQLQQP